MECFGLNMKYPPQVHVLVTCLVLSGSTILRSSGNFRKWDLVGYWKTGTWGILFLALLSLGVFYLICFY